MTKRGGALGSGNPLLLPVGMTCKDCWWFEVLCREIHDKREDNRECVNVDWFDKELRYMNKFKIEKQSQIT